MGCVCSRTSQGHTRYSALQRPAKRRSVDIEQEQSSHVVSLTSSSYGFLNDLGYHTVEEGSFISLPKKRKQVSTYAQDVDDDALIQAHDYDDDGADESFMFSSGAALKHAKVQVQDDPRSPLIDYTLNMETINTWELMEGLEDHQSSGGRTPSPHLKSISGGNPSPHLKSSGGSRVGKLSVPDKAISFKSLSQLDSSVGEMGSPVWRKYYIQEKPHGDKEHASPFSTSSPMLSPFEEPELVRVMSTRSSLVDVDADAISMSSIEPLDAANSTGLKLLLSPANSPSCYSSPLRMNVINHSTSLSFDGSGDSDRFYKGVIPRANSSKFDVKSPYKSPDMQRRSSRHPSITSIESLRGSGSPLFDPALMATFEQALTSSATTVHQEDWYSQLLTNYSTSATNSSSSDNTWASSDITSDADSIPKSYRGENKLSCFKIMPVDEEDLDEDSGLLGAFEARCPPRGEGKVVLYFTSLRGIRKTYEDCCNVRLILRGLGVQVDERDVWMHGGYREELKEMMRHGSNDDDGDDEDCGSGKQRWAVVGAGVPQLFIKGRHIGGAEEVRQLHEDGALERLLEGVPARGKEACEACGGARFVACGACSGSCKVRGSSGEVRRCLHCNENGLAMCPLCNAPY